MNTPITRLAHNTATLGSAAAAVILALALTACSDSSNSTATAATKVSQPLLIGCSDSNSCASNPPLEIGGDRLATVHIPSDYDSNSRYPLLIVLHGFGATGAIESLYLGFTQRVDAEQYVLITPDGTVNANGELFWNATPACCAFEDTERSIDDVAYIRSLIEEAASIYSIDTSRVALYGHSNGGFMALRLACEASDIVTTVISLAGSTWESAESCKPASYPVSVLILHGTSDETIPYDGEPGRYPGATETSERFAELAGCESRAPELLHNVDMDASVSAAETKRLLYTGCAQDTEVALWTINEGPHIPFPWTEDAVALTTQWLTEHPRVVSSSAAVD
ncbi:alpha/beta hydrolase-fold protein [Halioglobus sp.]|nr:alpha/beta hydrolase-fold protein [Halioglobus sp.]